jgi:hypothetical protein
MDDAILVGLEWKAMPRAKVSVGGLLVHAVSSSTF